MWGQCRKKGRQCRKEGRKEGREEGRKEGRKEGEVTSLFTNSSFFDFPLVISSFIVVGRQARRKEVKEGSKGRMAVTEGWK
jgi:predicted transposase YdaD